MSKHIPYYFTIPGVILLGYSVILLFCSATELSISQQAEVLNRVLSGLGLLFAGFSGFKYINERLFKEFNLRELLRKYPINRINKDFELVHFKGSEDHLFIKTSEGELHHIASIQTSKDLGFQFLRDKNDKNGNPYLKNKPIEEFDAEKLGEPLLTRGNVGD